jgi:hypothetical protein
MDGDGIGIFEFYIFERGVERACNLNVTIFVVQI